MEKKFSDLVKSELPSNTLLITCGLPATGKTTAADFVARLRDYKLLRTDVIRLKVLKGEDVFDEKVASNMVKRRRVYDEMLAVADELASKEKGILMDGTFITQALRRQAAGIAAKHHKNFVILETCCPQAVALKRISERSKKNGYESNAVTEQAYLNNKEKFEPVDLDDLKRVYPTVQIMYFLIDTASDIVSEWMVAKKEARS